MDCTRASDSSSEGATSGGKPALAAALPTGGGGTTGFGFLRSTGIGSSVMWQIGHSPGSCDFTCGCIGQKKRGACAVVASARANDHHEKTHRLAANTTSSQRTRAMMRSSPAADGCLDSADIVGSLELRAFGAAGQKRQLDLAM